MNNIQINGQRRWGPPENWNGPLPVHGTEVIVKNLPEQVFEFELSQVFSSVGTIYEVRLPVNWSGFNKGYAFVRFTQVCYADAAIRMLDGLEIRQDRKIKVTRSVDNTRLFLSAVPADKNAQQIKTALLNYVENVKKVYVYPTMKNRSVFRGYAFVEFETHRDAAIAKRILTPDMCYTIFEKKCVAAWANPLPILDSSTLKSLNVLFMRNIPEDVKGFQLKEIVENLMGENNQLDQVKRHNDFAFLTFKDHEAAERALTILRSVPLLKRDHEIQVEWAIPKELSSSCPPLPEKEASDLKTTNVRLAKFHRRKENESIENSAGMEFSSDKREIPNRKNHFPPRFGKELDITNDVFNPILVSLKNSLVSRMKYMGERGKVDGELSVSSGTHRREINTMGRWVSDALNVRISSSDTSPTLQSRNVNHPGSDLSSDLSRVNIPFTSEHYSGLLGVRKESLFPDDFNELLEDKLSSPVSVKIAGNATNNSNCPFIRTCSPDNDASRDAEGVPPNAGRSRQSSYSSWPPSPSTNYSSSSPTEMQWPQDERYLITNLIENSLIFK